MTAVELARTVEQDTRRFYTYDELVAEMPESNRPCELWDGELVMSPCPSFFHQEIVFRLHRLLHDWVAARGLGKVVGAPMDMVLSPRRVAQPDVIYIAKERLEIIKRVVMGPGDLVVEVISPGGRSRDRIEKRDLYEQHGVKEYWIVDPEAETVDVLFLETGVYVLVMRQGRGETAGSRLLPGFVVKVDELFQGGEQGR